MNIVWEYIPWQKEFETFETMIYVPGPGFISFYITYVFTVAVLLQWHTCPTIIEATVIGRIRSVKNKQNMQRSDVKVTFQFYCHVRYLHVFYSKCNYIC